MRRLLPLILLIWTPGCLESNPQPSPQKHDVVDRGPPDGTAALADTNTPEEVVAPPADTVADGRSPDQLGDCVDGECVNKDSEGDFGADVPDQQGGDPCQGIDPQPAASALSGYPMDGWNWAKPTLVLEPPLGTGSALGYRSPALVSVDGILHLYYVQYLSPTSWQARHATSVDGQIWSDLGPLAGLADDAGTLAVLHENGVFRLWHGAGSIQLSESSDGHSFTAVPNSQFAASGEPGFDMYSVLHPAVIHVDDQYLLFYTGFDGQGYALGRAISAYGVVWTRDPAGPVLTKGSAGELDNTAVAQSAVVFHEDQYWLWYGGYDTSKTNPGPYRIALARSSQGLVWQKVGLSVELSEHGPDAFSTRDPAVVRHGSGWLMVYVGMGEDLVYRLMSVRSTVCNH